MTSQESTIAFIDTPHQAVVASIFLDYSTLEGHYRYQTNHQPIEFMILANIRRSHRLTGFLGLTKSQSSQWFAI